MEERGAPRIVAPKATREHTPLPEIRATDAEGHAREPATGHSLPVRDVPSEKSRKSPLARVGRQGKKMLRKVTHVPRLSLLDRTNTSSAQDPFRGFYILFWIFTALLVLNAFMASFQSTGQVLSMTFATLMSRDAGILAVSDGVLVLSTFLSVAFIKVLHRFRLPYAGGIYALQLLWYVGLLYGVIEWIQSGFFVLHSLVMIMKVHSYLSVNGIMSDTFIKMTRLEKELDKKLTELYQCDIDQAWKRAVAATGVRPTATLAAVLDDNTPTEDPFGVWASRTMQASSSMVRAQAVLPKLHSYLPRAMSPMPEHRRLVGALDSDTLSDHPKKEEVKLEDCDLRDPHPFAWHPDATVRDLAMQIGHQREKLYAEPDGIQDLGPMWPANVTVANFWDFQLVPTLVYQLQYPRTERVRPLYVLERILATFGTFLVVYVIMVNWIMPVTLTPVTNLLEVFVRLAMPMMLCYLLIFYLMFECVCNGFAELTRFADREFYQDWWNSASMDEFARKWNRHVYVSMIFNWGLSKHTASLVTFFLSSVLHELVMIIVSGKLRGYLFFAQMSQYPLILLAQTPLIKNNRSLGNLIFWVGLMIGFPLLNIAYLVY